MASVGFTQVLNSHLDWIAEATIAFEDGRSGRGAAPRGETPSIYEHQATGPQPSTGDGLPGLDLLIGKSFDQSTLDAFVLARRGEWGADVAYALSTAFYEGTRIAVPSPPGVGDATRASRQPGDRERHPRLLFNLLNGGLHAYTNPIASDLTEILLVSRTDDLHRSIDGYRQMLAATRVALAGFPVTRVGTNLVHDLGSISSDAALGLARDLLTQEGLLETFGLMFDASAGDWWDGHRYHPPVSARVIEPLELVDEWVDLISRYGVLMAEDPFAETDVDAWHALHTARPAGMWLLGDNLTSTDPAQLASKLGLIDGVLVKPDQNGTVSGTRAFVDLAKAAALLVIASHRSIETDSPLLMHLASELEVGYVKVGPYSDFSSVMRTNELLRDSLA